VTEGARVRTPPVLSRLAAAAAVGLWLGAASDRAAADEPAPPPPPRPGVEAQVRDILETARVELARTAVGRPQAQVQARTGARLADLGPAAAPALAAALAREESEAVAGAIARGLRAFPSAVPAGPLVEALDRRRFAAVPALVRATGTFGGEAGARLVGSLLDESEREVEKLASRRTREAREAVEALRVFREAAVDALGESGSASSLERLFAMLSEPGSGARIAGPDPERVREAAGAALRRAVGRAVEPADIDRPLGAALARSRGPTLAALLRAAGGLRLPCLVPAARRALEEAGGLAIDAADGAALRRAAADALRPFAIGRDGPPERAAFTLYVSLLDADDDEALRLGIAIDLGRAGDLAAVPRLIDAYERDPSAAVRKQAHASLVRLAGGENLGDPAAWRDWYARRR